MSGRKFFALYMPDIDEMKTGEVPADSLAIQKMHANELLFEMPRRRDPDTVYVDEAGALRLKDTNEIAGQLVTSG